MGVGAHLNIRIEEYDARIRTFIPGYEQMLDAAAAALGALEVSSPVIVDLGTGTGALASRCISVRSDAKLIALDEDDAILELARRRLASLGTASPKTASPKTASPGAVASFVHSSFLATPLPRCDAIVASLALHHVHSVDRKQQLYRDCREALSRTGLLISVDCFVSIDARLAALEKVAWRSHLRQSYTEAETDGYFAAWAGEDTYMPLMQELAMLREAGFQPDVNWRVAPFAVIVARAC